MVGDDLLSRAGELREALEAVREDAGHAIAALMVTDIVARATRCSLREVAAVERAFGSRADDRAIALPGVMSRRTGRAEDPRRLTVPRAAPATALAWRRVAANDPPTA